MRPITCREREKEKREEEKEEREEKKEEEEEEREEASHLHLLLQVIAGDGGPAVGQGLGGAGAYTPSCNTPQHAILFHITHVYLITKPPHTTPHHHTTPPPYTWGRSRESERVTRWPSRASSRPGGGRRVRRVRRGG